MAARQHTSPKRLTGPGPDATQIDSLFRAAATAPDHGRLLPWRFVVVPAEQRARLAEAFALALVDRDPGATLVQIEEARLKAWRAPWVALAIARTRDDEGDACAIPAAERLVSLGCALQNLLLAAHSMGFGSGLTSGRAMDSVRVRSLFGVQPQEQAVCFVNVGTVMARRPVPPRPVPARFVSWLS
ncbi:MAG: nitroreductase [Methylibium sp.]|uniref:nitroreductase family protein n=1 Tax=Methylibium sp. Root1272 TaxID=1736441 RepID=UPI0006F9C919|nr:nitroreductase [Methylibium sp. Root1272]KQW66319.1 nitroreductase [Methylibium sp. Root1272]MDP1791473.1 nitroreductase [Methylibium sp.]